MHLWGRRRVLTAKPPTQRDMLTQFRTNGEEVLAHMVSKRRQSTGEEGVS